MYKIIKRKFMEWVEETEPEEGDVPEPKIEWDRRINTGARVRFTEDFEYGDFQFKAGDEAFVRNVYDHFGDPMISYTYEGKSTPFMDFSPVEILEPAWDMDAGRPTKPSDLLRYLGNLRRFERIGNELFYTSADGRRYLVELNAWDVTDTGYYAREGYLERSALHEQMFPPFGHLANPEKIDHA